MEKRDESPRSLDYDANTDVTRVLSLSNNTNSLSSNFNVYTVITVIQCFPCFSLHRCTGTASDPHVFCSEALYLVLNVVQGSTEQLQQQL